jgi:hypothetical protein
MKKRERKRKVEDVRNERKRDSRSKEGKLRKKQD